MRAGDAMTPRGSYKPGMFGHIFSRVLILMGCCVAVALAFGIARVVMQAM